MGKGKEAQNDSAQLVGSEKSMAFKMILSKSLKWQSSALKQRLRWPTYIQLT